MSLCVSQILQAMFNQPPLAVTVFHLLNLGSVQPAFANQRVQSGKRVELAKTLMPPAAQKLQQMHQQFNMPDPERAKLDIKTQITCRCRQMAQPNLQIIKHRIIQIAAPDK